MTDGTMPPKERDELILQYLAEHDIALPVTVLFFNMDRDVKLTFTKKTLRRRLSGLQERGFVNYIDEGLGYYEISESGREWLAAEADE